MTLPLLAEPTVTENSPIEATEQLIAESWQLWDRFRNDPHRPTYHFVPPAAWMNDINGAVYWKGRYHIFYQQNPDGGYWKWMQWGHASSVDLVHRVHHPIALTPDLDGPDRDGCFSGGAFISMDGTPMFIYHGVPDGTCLATSDDDLLLRWEKHPGNPVIPSVYEGQAGYDRYHVFDPCAWVQDGRYHALIGNRVPGVEGDSTALFKSDNLVDWEFVGPFYESDRRWTDALEDCAVPDFYPLGDRHMLLFCSHLQGTQYYLGTFENDRFTPDSHGWMGWPGGQMGGPRSLLDARGRRIFFDWVREMRDVESSRASGWSGVMTVPRVLTLADDGSLAINPVAELEALRFNPRSLTAETRLESDTPMHLPDISGDALELALTLELDHPDQRACVCVRQSPDGAESTGVIYDGAAGTLAINISQSSQNSSIVYPRYRDAKRVEQLPAEERYVNAQVAPFELRAEELLELRILLDRSILEVFANGRQCVTQRIYPSREDSKQVSLRADRSGATIRSLQAWDMAPTQV